VTVGRDRSIPPDVAARLARELDELCAMFLASSSLEASLVSLCCPDGATAVASQASLLREERPPDVHMTSKSLLSVSGDSSVSTSSTLSLCECSACKSSQRAGDSARCVRSAARSENRPLLSSHRAQAAKSKSKVRRKLAVTFDEFESALFSELFAADEEGRVDWDAWPQVGYSAMGHSEHHAHLQPPWPIAPTQVRRIEADVEPAQARAPQALDLSLSPGQIACASCGGKDAYIDALLLQVSQLRSANETLRVTCKADQWTQCCKLAAGLAMDEPKAPCALVSTRAAATQRRCVDLLFGKSS
jgi:hypothetical protein